jgi:hypothetical protein
MNTLPRATRLRLAAAATLRLLAALPDSLPRTTLLGAGTLAAAVALSVAAPADASLHLEVSLQHLVTVADLVVEATPQEAKSVWEDLPGVGRRIVTYTHLSVDQSVYGTPPSEVWVRTLGGQVGDLGQKVEGEAVLTPGDRQLLFLRAGAAGTHRVVEMAQGQYLVHEESNARRVKASPFLGKVIPDKSEEVRAKAARTMLENKLVADAVTLIRTTRSGVSR